MIGFFLFFIVAMFIAYMCWGRRGAQFVLVLAIIIMFVTCVMIGVSTAQTLSEQPLSPGCYDDNLPPLPARAFGAELSI